MSVQESEEFQEPLNGWLVLCIVCGKELEVVDGKVYCEECGITGIVGSSDAH